MTSNSFLGQPQNVNIVTADGNDLDASNGLPVSTVQYLDTNNAITPLADTEKAVARGDSDHILFVKPVAVNQGTGLVEPVSYLNPMASTLVDPAGTKYSASFPVPSRHIGLSSSPVTLSASATLPASGVYQNLPLVGAMIAVPQGARRASIYVSYTRGAAGGQAAHKIFVTDGTNIGQLPSMDGTYNGFNGAPSASAGGVVYVIPVDLIGAEAKISIISAEIGVTANPGTCAATIMFG